jgi:ABC-type nitrate/sulfonate/bicarbonate transport system substrate-binding protein
LASDLGLFRKYGIDLESVFIGGGATRTAAISAGEIQFGVDSAVSPITSSVLGADVTVVATYYNKNPWVFIARPEIRTSQDLKGKKIGVISIGASNHMSVASALRYWRIDERSVTILRAGGSAERFVAMQKGMIDATVVTSQDIGRARKAGLRVLLELADTGEAYPTASIVTTKRMVASKRAVVKQFLKGISEGVYVFRNDRGKAIKTLEKWMKTADKDLLEEAYQSHAPKMNFPPFTDLSGVQSVLDFLSRTLSEAKKKKPQDFVDEEILKELETEGFFKTIASR